MPDKFSHAEAAASMVGVGLMIGLGQLLASEEELTARIIFGRAISSAGLSLAAGAALLQIPDMPLLALLGLSALLASLGTSFLERFTNKYFGGS